MHINLGDAFLINTNPNEKHLFVAIACLPNQTYLFVNTSTVRPNRPVDTACILFPCAGMHNFIVNESYIVYRKACTYTNAQISAAIANGSFIRRGAFGTPVLRQIQKGGLASKLLAKEYKEYLESIE